MKISDNLFLIILSFCFTFLVVFALNSNNEYEIKQLEPNNRNININIVNHSSFDITKDTKIQDLNKERLLISITYVESRYNKDAIGDNGKSFGLFQVKNIFYNHHKELTNDNFDEYISDEFIQIEFYLKILNKYKHLTVYEFAKNVQKPFNPISWTDKVVNKYNEL
jgi:hypothetical protein